MINIDIGVCLRCYPLVVRDLTREFADDYEINFRLSFVSNTTTHHVDCADMNNSFLSHFLVKKPLDIVHIRGRNNDGTPNFIDFGERGGYMATYQLLKEEPDAFK